MVRGQFGRRWVSVFSLALAASVTGGTAAMASAGGAPAALQQNGKTEGVLVTNAAQGRIVVPDRKPGRRAPVQTASLAATVVTRGKLLLRAGTLEARIENAAHDTKVRVGDSRVIDIVLSNTSDKRSGPAELLLVGTGARFVRAQGGDERKRIRARRAGDGHVIAVGRLPAHSSRTVFLELKLKGAKSAEPDEGLRAQVQLALWAGRASDPVPDSTQLDWAVANPAMDYHRALLKLDKENGEEIFKSVQEARVGNDALPGRWYFKPVSRKAKPVYKTVERTETQRYCAGYRRATRRERRRARRRGRRIRRICARHATRQVVRKVRVRVKQNVSAVSKEENRFVELAANAVRSKGAAPLLRKPNGAFGWIGSRIAVDLRAYMAQPAHPALCTGMDTYMDYLHDNAVSFRRRIAEMHASRKRAPTLAAALVRDLRKKLWAHPSGHPGAGAAPLAIMTPFPDDADVLMSLSELAGHTVALTSSQNDGAAVARTPDILEALKRASAAAQSSVFKDTPADIHRAARRALTMIEASHYLRLGDVHYSRVETALFGGIRNVREAHAQNCVASG